MKVPQLTKHQHRVLVFVGLFLCVVVSVSEAGYYTHSAIIQFLVNAFWLLEPEA